jgi:hypothetical protein
MTVSLAHPWHIAVPQHLSLDGMLGSMTTDAEGRTAPRPRQENRPTARALIDSDLAGPRRDTEDVEQLRDALRAARRAHRAYLAELRQGGVEPLEDWSTWYAEYLLGLR